MDDIMVKVYPVPISGFRVYFPQSEVGQLAWKDNEAINVWNVALLNWWDTMAKYNLMVTCPYLRRTIGYANDHGGKRIMARYSESPDQRNVQGTGLYLCFLCDFLPFQQECQGLRVNLSCVLMVRDWHVKDLHFFLPVEGRWAAPK